MKSSAEISSEAWDDSTEIFSEDGCKTELFSKAEEYMEKIKSELDQTDNEKKGLPFAEYQKKLQGDLEEAGVAVETVCAWAAWPKKMVKKKDEQLKMLIDKNNKGELDNVSIIGFLTELYIYYGWRFTDLDSSWMESLNYIHEASKNQQLIGLIDELFSSS